MSIPLLVCFRENVDTNCFRPSISKISEQLTPGNIEHTTPSVFLYRSLILVDFLPNSENYTSPNCICAGKLIGSNSQIEDIGSPAPDGSFALFRTSARAVEIVSDTASSRTIWYTQTPDIFVASTSQRAIMPFLGNLDPNKAAVAWRLSSGHLGPGLSWDKRIHPLPSRSSLLFDRKTWSASTNHGLFPFVKKSATSDQDRVRHLRDQVTSVFDSIEVDTSKWLVTLSGGTESRLNLLMLRKKGEPCALTYGTSASRFEPNSDALIAEKLTKALGVKHIFLETDRSEDNISEIMTRFVQLTEGQNDGLKFYMDGYGIWKEIKDSGIKGIVRGDAPFGSARPPYSDMDIRNNTFLLSAQHIRQLEQFDSAFPDQAIPEQFKRRPDESLPMWRDRLYLQIKMPCFTSSGANSLTHYLEIFNPLLSKKILDSWTDTGDSMRNNKSIFRRILNEVSPSIPYAQADSNRKFNHFLDGDEARRFLSQKINTNYSRQLLSDELIDFTIEELKKSTTSPVYRLKKTRIHWILSRVYERLVPMLFERFLPKESNILVQKSVSPGVLAFRIYAVLTMHETLRDFAQILSKCSWPESEPSKLTSEDFSPDQRETTNELLGAQLR